MDFLQEIKFGRAVLLSTVDGGVDLEVWVFAREIVDMNSVFDREKGDFLTKTFRKS